MTKETFDALLPLFIEGLVLVIGIVVAAVGKEGRRLAKNNANNAGFEFVLSVARAGVQAAEQVYGEYEGEKKKAYAIEFAEKWLAAKGVEVDLDVLSTAIESAVLNEFNHPALAENVVLPAEVYSPQPGEDVGEAGEELPVFPNADERPDTEV